MRAKILAVYGPPRRHEITGPWPAVGAALDCAERSGRLVTDRAQVLRGVRRLPDGRVQVRVDLLERTKPRREFPVAHALLLASGFAVAVFGLILAVVYALAAMVVEALGSQSVRGVLAVTTLVVVLWLVKSVTSGHACRGIHCAGCGHR